MLRTLLFRPRDFFEGRRDDLNGVTGGGVVLAFAVATTAVIAVLVRVLTGQISGTTTVPNPDRPPASECSGTAGATPTACARPTEITVDVGPLVWQRSTEVFPVVFFALIGVALLLAVALYLGAKLGHGTGSFGETVEVAAWGLLPLFGAILLGTAALLVFASQLDLAVASPEAIQSRFAPVQRGTSGLALLAIQLGGAVWQAYIWAAGLRVVHGFHRYGAILLAVLVATIPVLLV